MTNENDRKEAMDVLRRILSTYRELPYGIGGIDEVVSVNSILAYSERIRLEAVKSERERCAKLAMNKVHEWKMTRTIPDVYEDELYHALLTAKPEPCEDLKTGEMLRANRFYSQRDIDALLAAEPEPCEDTVESCDTILIGVQDELGIEISEESWARLSDLVISPLLATQVADKRVEELRAQVETLREAVKKLYQSYVNMMETARDRIISYGGTCDPVDVMEAQNYDLKEAREALASTEPKP